MRTRIGAHFVMGKLAQKMGILPIRRLLRAWKIGTEKNASTKTERLLKQIEKLNQALEEKQQIIEKKEQTIEQNLTQYAETIEQNSQDYEALKKLHKMQSEELEQASNEHNYMYETGKADGIKMERALAMEREEAAISAACRKLTNTHKIELVERERRRDWCMLEKVDSWTAKGDMWCTKKDCMRHRSNIGVTLTDFMSSKTIPIELSGDHNPMHGNERHMIGFEFNKTTRTAEGDEYVHESSPIPLTGESLSPMPGVPSVSATQATTLATAATTTATNPPSAVRVAIMGSADGGTLSTATSESKTPACWVDELDALLAGFGTSEPGPAPAAGISHGR